MIGRTNSSSGRCVIPDGATIEPIDDVKIWLKCAGLGGTGYTTIDQILADITTIGSLTMDENAMTYLARSEGFADELCADETFMTYLGQSTYVDETVLNSGYWVKKIPMSPYWSKVSNIIVVFHGAASETITINGLYGSPTVTTNSTGDVNYQLPIGTFTFSGSVSGKSFTRSITRDTTDVYVMPEGRVIYWYGNNVSNFTVEEFLDTGGMSTNYMYLNRSGNRPQLTIKFGSSLDISKYSYYNEILNDTGINSLAPDNTIVGLIDNNGNRKNIPRTIKNGTERLKIESLYIGALSKIVNRYCGGGTAHCYAIWFD